jgi:hypothetical protein
MFLALGDCATITTTFDLWMSKTRFHTFKLIMKFINKKWVPYHITILLFEAPHTSRANLN